MGSWRNSNSSKLLQLSLLYARMKKIHSKLKALEWMQHFSHYKSKGIFPNAQGQVTHKSLLNFEPIQDFMGLLVACKNEEDSIKNE